MMDFRLDAAALRSELQRIERHAAARSVDLLVGRARSGAGLDPLEIAALWFSPALDTGAVYDLALETRRRNPRRLETFAPLYMTNTCDAECRMCGMRRDNDALRRETVGIAEVEEQLRILSRRGMHGVSLLTGEYRGERRDWAIDLVNRGLRAARSMRFTHILINAGSFDEPELERLLAGIERREDGSVAPKLTMCTFQETYSPERYAKFMGAEAANPRADYERRLTNFDRSFRAGLRVANPGILLGLDPDLAFEIAALAMHANHLLARGMEVYLSIPRLRRIAGGSDGRGVSDEQFVRLTALLSLGVPAAKTVLTTREPSSVQRRLVPLVAVLSAGSASVAPYTDDGARFPLETSQFEVIDQRPFEAILAEYLPERGAIENFAPPGSSGGRASSRAVYR
jgi:2-iminoacetate synthase